MAPRLVRGTLVEGSRLLPSIPPGTAGDPAPFVTAMQKIQDWSASFDYEDLDGVIDSMKACNAFEQSLVQYRLLTPKPIVGGK